MSADITWGPRAPESGLEAQPAPPSARAERLRALPARLARPALARNGAAALVAVRASWLVRDVVLPFALTRLLLQSIGLLALAVLPLAPWPGAWTGWSAWWMDIWSRWDGRWYLSILTEGYFYVPGEQSNVAFSPLYPLAMRAGGMLLGRDHPEGWIVAGILISNLASLAALATLHALVRLDFDRRTAARTVLYLLLFPASLFLSAVYADALFLALSLGAVYSARTRRWWLAGALGGLGALARPHGFLVLLPLAAELVREHGFSARTLLRREALALALVPAGLAVWGGYLYSLSGDPLLFVRAQAAWGRSLTPPWDLVLQFLQGPVLAHGTIEQGWDRSLLDLGFTLGFLVLVGASWRLLRPSYALYASALFLSIISNGTLAASMRYGLAMFPAFMVLALAGRDARFHQGYLVGSAMLGGLLMGLFALGYWVA